MIKEITEDEIIFVRNKLKLSTRSKILNLSHNDLDGVGASIIVANCFKDVTFVKVKYTNIDQIISEINFADYDAVVITDVSPLRAESLEHDKILLLDHHDTALRYHDPEKCRFVISGESGMTITKKFFEKYYNIHLKHLDELDFLVNDYDMWNHLDPRSRLLNQLYVRYWDEKFRDRFKKGFDGFSLDEKAHFKKVSKELEDIYDNLEVWEIRPDMKIGLFSSFKYSNEICDRLLKEKGYRFVVNRNPKTKNCSIRSDLPDLHLGNMLQDLGFGGGHKHASSFYAEETELFQERMEKIIDVLEKGNHEELMGSVLV